MHNGDPHFKKPPTEFLHIENLGFHVTIEELGYMWLFAGFGIIISITSSHGFAHTYYCNSEHRRKNLERIPISGSVLMKIHLEIS